VQKFTSCTSKHVQDMYTQYKRQKYRDSHITATMQYKDGVEIWISNAVIPTILVLLFALSLGFPLIFIAEAKKVNIGEGDSITLRLEIDESTRIHELSFDIKRMQSSNPFSESYSRIPVTVEIIENGDIVGSESMTAHVENRYKEINIDMNNDPKVGGSFNVVIKFEIPEDDGHDPQIRVDTDSIKVIDNKKNDLDIVRVTTDN
jgi:hypothetical protein